MASREERIAQAKQKWERGQRVAEAKAKWQSQNEPKDEAKTVMQQAGESGQAALESFGNAASLGYAPHLQAMTEKLLPDPNADIDAKLEAQGFKVKGAPEKTYTQLRDENIARADQMKRDNPVASGVGTIAGIAASAIGTGGLGAVAKGATGVQRAKAALMSGGILGAVANPGDTKGELSPIQPEDRLVNSAVGAGLGLAGQGLSEGLGAIAKPVSNFLGNKAGLKATRAVGRPTPTQAKLMAKSGDDVAIGKALLAGDAVPVFGSSARIAKRVEDLRSKSWDVVENLLNSGGDEAVVDGAAAGMKILQSDDLALLRKAGETQSVKALENAAEELAGMGNITLQDAQKIKRVIDKNINYNKAIPDMTGTNAARFDKRSALRDQMDEAVSNISGKDGALKAAYKKQGLFEKATEIAESEAGRNQANGMFGLGDKVLAAGGAAGGIISGDSPEEKAMYGILLGALGKGGRTYGNAMQARGYNALAKQIAKIPRFSQFAEKNPAAFSAMFQRVADKIGASGMQPRLAESDSGSDRKPSTLKGEAKWKQDFEERKKLKQSKGQGK